MIRFLFVKESLAWPRSAGHDVHTYFMMRSLARLGHETRLLTAVAPSAECLGDYQPTSRSLFTDWASGPSPRVELSRAQEKFRSYWGIDQERIHAVARAATAYGSDVVVVAGLEVLPYLGGVRDRIKVWYAGDEWVWHHLSQFRPWRRSTWENVKEAAVKGLYERAYGSLLDRVWVVSDGDQRAMRWVVGARGVDVLPNGVDSDHFAPRDTIPTAKSCAFWGRLDFGPNIDALEWFCGKVWPLVRRREPDARFQVYGFQPTVRAESITRAEGIALTPNLPDLRGEIARHAVVVLPFVSGGGIKNKLLEAASLAKPIIVSSIACNGLKSTGPLPLRRATRPEEWADALVDLWKRPDEQARLGRAAREWVIREHDWDATAQLAVEGLTPLLRLHEPRIASAGQA